MSQIISTLIDQNTVEAVLKKKSPNTESIKALQRSLYELGYAKELNWNEYGADGDFGGGTTAAVKAFALTFGEKISGEVVSADLAIKIVGLQEVAEDLRLLKKAADANQLSILKQGSTDKAAIRGLQRILHMLGFDEQLNWEKYGADGDYGGGTTAAVTAFGTKEDIPTSGEKIDVVLANKMLENFIPYLGEGWKEAEVQTPVINMTQRRRGKGQFFRLYPKGDRDFKGIEKKRKKGEKETYISPTPTNVKRKKRDKELRFYTYEFEKGRHEISGEDLEMSFYEVKKINKAGSQVSSFCYAKDHHQNETKDRIVLHFTAGQTLGDLKTLTQEDYHVSTAYILGRDGVIYRLFAPEQWAYHLGRTGYTNSRSHNARSIGIEISNYGYLEEDGRGNLNFGDGNLFCSLADTDAYIKLDKSYRGYNYYAAYTDKQYEGLIVLLRYLTKQFSIEKNFLSAPAEQVTTGDWEQIPRFVKFKSQAEADAFRGICSHINYRDSGKWDLGPSFDWDRVITAVTADSFTPQHLDTTRDFFGGAPLRSEAELLEKATGLDHGNQDTSIYGPDGPEVDI
ncbi:N-acetylmuramoyl-L-alanine amidase [bacterium]|nr:N-acetylmuramoyl-L-alanine amidase [bacterium]